VNTRKDKESPPILPPPLFLLPQSCEPSLASPTVPLRGLAGRYFYVCCHRWACRPSDVCCSEEIEKRLTAPLVGKQPRNLGAVLAPGWARGLLVSSKTVVQRVFCCGQFLNRCNLIPAPPTAGVRASSGPRKVLSCQAVPRLELVEAGGKALVGTRHRFAEEDLISM